MTAFPHQLIQCPDPPALMQACSLHLEQRLQQRLSEVQPRPLGLATGRTMEPLYAALVQRLQRWEPDVLQQLRQHWLSFNLDEYVGLPAGDPAGYRFYMQQHLAAPLGLTADQVRLPEGNDADPDEAAAAYGRTLEAAGGVGLQLLGLGSNGHVGFNEPPCGPSSSCHVVRLSAATRQQNAGLFGGNAELVPPRAITLGLAEILQAQEIHLVVTGRGKAGILQRLLRDGPSEALPASWLRQHQQVWLWVDQAAMG